MRYLKLLDLKFSCVERYVYIKQHGGKEDRLKDFIASEIHKAQVKAINKNFKLVSAINKANDKDFERLKKTKPFKNIENSILKSIAEIRSQDMNIFLNKKFNDVLDFETAYQLNEESCYCQSSFFPISNTDDKTINMKNIINIYNDNIKILLKLYDLGFTDDILEKYYGNAIDINETIGTNIFEFNIATPFKSEYYNFFNTYKQNQIDYKNIDYALPYTVIKTIIIKSRKKFL